MISFLALNYPFNPPHPRQHRSPRLQQLYQPHSPRFLSVLFTAAYLRRSTQRSAFVPENEIPRHDVRRRAARDVNYPRDSPPLQTTLARRARKYVLRAALNDVRTSGTKKKRKKGREDEALDLVRGERSNATVHLLQQIVPDKCGGPANVISRESSITIFSCSVHFDTMQT